MKHQAKKRFGQNFLVDQSIIQSLISAIQPQENDLMVEIGPGLGALTKPLLAHLKHLHLVEIDRDIIEWMQGQYPAEKITIHASDVLKFDFAQLLTAGNKLRVEEIYPITFPALFCFICCPRLHPFKTCISCYKKR